MIPLLITLGMTPLVSLVFLDLVLNECYSIRFIIY
jgi:hypothetical protein